MSNDEKISDDDNDEDVDDTSCVDQKLIKQLQAITNVFNTLKEFSSNPIQRMIEDKVGDLTTGIIEQAFTRHTQQDPLKMAMNSAIQRMIVENIEWPILPHILTHQPKEEGKSKSNDITRHKDIYKKLSPGDIYITRIMGDELEYIKNHNGEVIHKRIKLSP